MPKKAIPDDQAHVTALGMRLRGRRLWLELSMAEIAAAIGVTFQQIQKYEGGKNDLSTLGLVRIAAALETTPHKLLGWTGSEPANDMTALLSDPSIAAIVHRLRAMDGPRRRLCHALVCQVDAQHTENCQ